MISTLDSILGNVADPLEREFLVNLLNLFVELIHITFLNVCMSELAWKETTTKDY